MKKVILTVMVLIAFALATTLRVDAQNSYQCVRAQVPFEFVVNGQTLPVGIYDFCWNHNFVAAIRLAVPSNANSQPIRYTQISTVDPNLKDKIPSVLFHQLVNRYFLAEIHQPSGGLVVLTTTRQEKKMLELAKLRSIEIEAESGK